MSQELCLKWNNHINVIKELTNFLLHEVMVDVTLVCEGKRLKAHKIILSSCSPFFRSLLLENPCTHPIMMFNDMNYFDLKAIIDFMYLGEITVGEDKLSTLLKTAENLKVKGLGEMRTNDNQFGDECETAIYDESENHVEVRTENDELSDEWENPPFDQSELSVCSTDISNFRWTPDQLLHDESEDEVYEPEIKQELLSDNESMELSAIDSATLQSVNTNSFQGQQSIHNNSALEENSRPNLILKQLLTANRDSPKEQPLKSSLLSDQEKNERKSPDHSLISQIQSLRPCVVVLNDVMSLIRNKQQTQSSSGTPSIPVLPADETEAVQPSTFSTLTKTKKEDSEEQDADIFEIESEDENQGIESEYEPTYDDEDEEDKNLIFTRVVTTRAEGPLAGHSYILGNQPTTSLPPVSTPLPLSVTQLNMPSNNMTIHHSAPQLQNVPISQNAPQLQNVPISQNTPQLQNVPIHHNPTQPQSISPVSSIASQAHNMNFTQDSVFNCSNKSRGQLPNVKIGMHNTPLIPVPNRTLVAAALIHQVAQHQTRLLSQSAGQTSLPVSQQSTYLSTSMPSAVQSKSQNGTNQTTSQYSKATTPTSTSNIMMQQSVPTVTMSSNQLNQQQANVPSGSGDECTIWQGAIEFHEANLPNQIVTYTLPCTFSSLSANRDPDLNTDRWPNRLILHLTSSLQSVPGDNLCNMLKTDARSVLIQFKQDSEASLKLNKLMSLGCFGYILFPQNCNYRMMVVLYSPIANKYMGFIRCDQKTFHQTAKQIYENQQTQKQKLPVILSCAPSSARLNTKQPETSTNDNSNLPSVSSIDVTSDESVVDSQHLPASSDKKLQNNTKLEKVRKKYVHQSSSSPEPVREYNVRKKRKALNKITNSKNAKRLVVKFYKCRMCYFQTVSQRSLKNHISTMHEKRKTVKNQFYEKKKTFCCPSCSYKASTPYFMMKHIEGVHHENEERDFRTSGKTSLKKHKTTAHGNKVFSCHVCNYQSDIVERIKEHVEEHAK